MDKRVSTSSESPAALVGMKRKPRPQVLVVDDECTNVELLQRYLQREGYEVASAFDGRQALEQVKKTIPDLILLDIRMPVMDGLSVCHTLRNNITTRSIPIIFLTAHNTLPERLVGLRAGVDDYMGKPFELAEVKARLESALERRRWDISSHPLTRLPGSPMIEEEVWKRLREGHTFAFAYIDVDHFKAFNDVYGYEAGDRVIKSLASSLVAQVERSASSSFAGHIGGDDFVFMASIDEMMRILLEIASRFDSQRGEWYRPEDLVRGTLRTRSRQGQILDFPLMTLSVAVVSTATRRILHYARLVEIVSELKRFIKTQEHFGRSLVLWDRRKDTFKGTST